MKGTILTRIVFNREIFIYLPEGYDTSNKIYPVVYSHDGDKFKGFLIKIIDDIEEGFSKGLLEEHIIVGITPIDRLNEYTPWFSKSQHERFHDFEGQADKYLRFLLKDLQGYIENEFKVSTNKKDRKIMGHSLGGLVSLYSIYKNNNYGKIASICASQWYERWINFISEENIVNDDFKLIIIAGKKEGHNKVTIQRYMPKFSEQSYEIFKRRIGEENVKMLWDDYDHHENMLNRNKIALEFLLSKN
ncbi:alpha/beta hydrolase [Clostridium amazonitimonense]|uniref:alpha/beta hydrolase n=1 Tax=Clostridium amazonitimonense TaxID=1499689 RepID=UPI0005098D6E|nr:alpha/beta hydrolase-fold protein [Clostridium amazonitimonense]